MITTESLSKAYGAQLALNSLTLSLDQGEVFGFLGPNGAGKTTTVKLLTGILSPTSGSCRVLGEDPASCPEKVHRASGIVTEHAQMYDELTGLENLVFYGSLFGVPQQECQLRARKLLERLDLAPAAEKKLSSYSTGMRQKLSLARALIHRPQVLFLDEPTSGLDPESVQNVNALIRDQAKEGAAVFLCTHQLRYAQEVCTRYGLLSQGSLLAQGTLGELRSRAFSQVTVSFCATLAPQGRPCRRVGEGEVQLEVAGREEIPQLVRDVVERGGDVYQVAVREPSLEDVYFALTAGEKEGSL